MKYHQRKLCSFLLLFVPLLLASFVLPATTALFVANRPTCTRIQQRRRVDTFRCGSSNGNDDDNYFGQGGNDNDNNNDNNNAEERQDAYGRTIQNDTNSDENNGPPDPLTTTATTTMQSHQINLDPLVVCGPSGVGKGTVIESLRNRFPPDVFGFSVSHTTRQPRPGEIHGQHYNFATQEEIQTDIDQGLFVEHALVHGNYYGTSKQAIEVLQSEGKITILDIDMQGVISVKESGIPAKYVFIAPPSRSELEDRLRGRGTETEEAIQKRLGNAAQEIEYGEEEGNFDRLFVNHDVETTVDEMVEVLSEWFPQLKTIQDTTSSEVKEESTIRQEQQSPAKAPSSQPFDFLAESDKMLQFPSVREGHGRLEAVDRSPEDGSGSNGKQHGYYVVDLEEPDDSRSYPKLGKTNPTIVLDNEGVDNKDENAN